MSASTAGAAVLRLEGGERARAAAFAAEAAPRFPLVDATIASARGEVFAGVGEGYDSCLVLHPSGFGRFFARGDRRAAFRDLLASLPGEERIPGYFHLYAADPEEASLVGESPLRARVRRRVRLEHRGGGRTGAGARTPAGYRILPLDAVAPELLRREGLGAYLAFWSSAEELRVEAFGACALDASGEPAALCYAAAAAEGIAEVDILTLPEHRGRGVGAALAAAFVAAARDRALVAGWDCFVDNTPSLRIARGAGFREVAEYDFLSIYDASKDTVRP